MIIRPAGENDIPLLLRHRRMMFEDMYSSEECDIPGDYFAAMEQKYPEFVRQHLAAKNLFAWVVELNKKAIASAVLSLLDWPPNPVDQRGKMAYLYSLCVEREFRRRGAARLLMNTMLDFCRAQEIRNVTLSASRFGRSLYEELGFVSDGNLMRKYL